MRSSAALACLMLGLLAGTAKADPAGDYKALLTAAEDGDPGVDYTAMRLAYAQLAQYDPYGIKTKTLMHDGRAAYAAKDCKTALAKFKAAIAIDCYLRGVELPPEPPEPIIADVYEPAFQFHLREYRKEPRCTVESTPASKRKGSFKEVNLGFADKDTCVTEARRCLTCRCSAVRY